MAPMSLPAGSSKRILPPETGDSVSASLFRPGHNCCRVAHAERVSLLIDGEAYFSAMVRAAQLATHSILIVAWDFHSRTRIHHDTASDVPQLLGDFLNSLVRRRRSLHINVLIWDYPMLFARGREMSPIYGFGWHPHRRVHVRYDAKIPVGASHHQKIVAIDDSIAFCGGLDLTRSRWDTSDHRPGDERRVNPGEEECYAPFHDVMMAVDGDAAQSLAQLARERWSAATGKTLPKPRRRHEAWPASLKPSLTNIEVAVSRTSSAADDGRAVHEVESMYLDIIASAKRYLYIENQYFTSDTLGHALAERLVEPDGPEVIVALRLSTDGWLEAPTMGALRTRLLMKLRDADQHGRFHAYYPYIPGLPDGQCCDLHSKLIVVDDEIVHLGSANFCNRSMGLDTECDVTIEARGERRLMAPMADFINELLGEHLCKSADEVAAARRTQGSLNDAILSLTSEEGRTLRPFVRLDDVPEIMLSIATVADPEKPISLDELVEEFAPEIAIGKGTPAWKTMLATAIGLIALAAVWRYTPLSQWTDSAELTEWASAFASKPWAPLVVLLAYTPASIVLFPRPLITLVSVVAFGAWLGFAYAFSGIMLAAVATYGLGRIMDRSYVRRIAGARINRLTQAMRKRGLIAVTLVRFVPIAPFAVVNIVAGAFRIRLRDFVGGSAIGILPGTLVATVFGDQLLTELRNPGAGNLGLLAGVLSFAALMTWTARRYLSRLQPESHGRSASQPSR